jgi:hypothetical protein
LTVTGPFGLSDRTVPTSVTLSAMMLQRLPLASTRWRNAAGDSWTYAPDTGAAARTPGAATPRVTTRPASIMAEVRIGSL